MATETVIHDPSGDIDLTMYTDEERTAILSIIEKAKNFQQQEENKFRQPMEGQLSKWTNYVRGWQYRWFTLDPDTGMLDYYMEKEKIKQGPRGSVNLAGAVVSPSDEDSFTFSVNAVNGDVFKLRANNAKERQHWINALRSVAQYHDSNMAQAAPPLHPSTHGQPTSPLSTQSSGQTISSTATQPAQVTTTPTNDDNVRSGRSHFKGPQSQFHHVPSYVTDELVRVRDILHNIEDEQTAMIDQLEMEPENEESVFPLDEHVLVLKATSQSTLNSLHHCFSILQRRVDDAQREQDTIHDTPTDQQQQTMTDPTNQTTDLSPSEHYTNWLTEWFTHS